MSLFFDDVRPRSALRGRRTSAVISSTCPVTFVVSSFEFVSTSSFENTIDKVALVHIAVCKIEYSFPCMVLSSCQTMIGVSARWDCHEELTLTLVLVEVALVLVPVPPTIHSGVVYKFTFVIVAIWILPSSHSCPKQKKGGKVTEMTNVCVSYAMAFHRGFTTHHAIVHLSNRLRTVYHFRKSFFPFRGVDGLSWKHIPNTCRHRHICHAQPDFQPALPSSNLF